MKTKAVVFLCTVLSLSLIAGCATSSQSRGERMNKELVLRNAELWAARDAEAAGETYAEDYLYHGPGGSEIRGREGIKGLWAAFFASFPDLSTEIDDIVAEGDRVVLRWTVTGTHTGADFNGIPASGKSFVLPVLELFRIEDGYLAEAWDFFDQLTLLQQLGGLPEAE